VQDKAQFATDLGSGIRRVRLDGNHWPWMTLKAVTRYYG